MKSLYSIISCIFLVLSILPFLLIQFSFTAEYYTVVTLGQKGKIGIVIPILYSVISLIFATLSKHEDLRRTLLIASLFFLFINSALAFVAIFGLQNP
ncbi:hypothetical protein BAMA_04080 [Bacillus manliponensis]|uniref:Uncharacterized protein n=1 Tax=Bacillus manliponensis TaxID=574376 RepID=A0A073JWU6_9BACI|nr:hypothetical protein BAMA_04080 [Bacillus manliponensis]